MKTSVKMFSGDIYYSERSMDEMKEMLDNYSSGHFEVWAYVDNQHQRAIIDITRIESVNYMTELT